jgi:hypothetical protein
MIKHGRGFIFAGSLTSAISNPPAFRKQVNREFNQPAILKTSFNPSFI